MYWASNYETYGYHSYNQKPITDLENISYLTLKVFTPIRNIFSAKINGNQIQNHYREMKIKSPKVRGSD